MVTELSFQCCDNSEIIRYRLPSACNTCQEACAFVREKINEHAYYVWISLLFTLKDLILPVDLLSRTPGLGHFNDDGYIDLVMHWNYGIWPRYNRSTVSSPAPI